MMTMVESAAVHDLSQGKGAAAPHLPMTTISDSELLATLQSLSLQNDQAIRVCKNVLDEAISMTNSHHRAKEAITKQLAGNFRPEVLQVLKRNADQLLALKKQHIAEKQASIETSKRLMSWANNHQQGTAGAGDDTNTMQQDAVKHGRFKYFQLSGSNVAAGGGSGALRFWQTGMSTGTGAPRLLSRTNGAMDQQQLQKSLSTMLFGKNRRSSSSSLGTAPISPGRISDTGGSWRSSDSGSRRSSRRSSDTGPFRKSASRNLGQAGARSGPDHQVGSLWASLTSGEGPLSKSHSLLAKPGLQADHQLMGRSLDIVAEDEREGHDSPQPGAVPSNSKSSQNLATTIRQIVAGGGRSNSPMESFSFGNRAAEEPHSPNLLRASVSSRQLQAASGLPAAAGTAGPLVRSSVALHSSRVDPFDAPEPQLQPFVEQMRVEDQAMRASQTAAATGLMGALRRSFSGPAKAAMLLQGNKGKLTGRPAPPAPGASPLAADGGVGAQQLSVVQPPPAQMEAAAQVASGDGYPTPGDNVEMLDLDASRAYAMGVHSMLQGMATALSGSEISSKQTSPRISELNVGLKPNTTAAGSTALPQLVYSSEIEPAEEQPSMMEATLEEPSLGPVLEVQQQLQQLLGRSSQRQLTPPSAALSPQASGHMLPPQNSRTPAAAAVGAAGGTSRPLRPSSASAADSRHQSHAASAAAGQAAALGLPVLGQASIDILGRPSASLLQQERRPLSSSSSMSVRLTDVYQQTAGNLNPLSTGLNTFKRSSSYGTRPPRVPSARTSPRTSTHDASQPGYGAPAPVGPLSAQRSSSMLHAKRPQPAGLVSPRENRTSAWGWQSLGLPTGPGAPLADPTPDPAAYGTGNKYATSWGLVDAATTAAASTAPGGALSRQASANGGLSRQHSVVMQGQLSRQNSTLSTTPRSPFQQQQVQQQSTGRQQWHQGGAAGRYAGPASTTPTSQSPRSERATPGRAEQYGAGVSVAAAAAAVRGRQASAAAALHSRRISNTDSMMSDDDGFDTAEENSASSSYAGSVGRAPASRGDSARAAAASAHMVPARARGSPVPAPPTFLTSAQAAVAAQWSPNKHASAIAQAPTYARGGLVAEVSDVIISEGQGLQPSGLSSYLSPREDGAVAGAADAGYGRPAPATATSNQTPQAAYAGGYSIYSPLAPPAGLLAKPPGTAPPRMAGHYHQQQQQQQQHVVTAVDLARSRSGIRRTSSSSSGGHAGYTKGYGAGYLNNNTGRRGAQPVAAAAAAGRTTYGYEQQRSFKQRPY